MMEKIIKLIKFGREVNTFIGDILDPIVEGIEFIKYFYALARKYIHVYPYVKIDDVNFEIKLSHSLTIDPLKESSDLKTNTEAIIKKLQSGEYIVLFDKTLEYN